MAVTGRKWCDFGVFTECGVWVERIRFCPQFWDRLLARLRAFYFADLLPALLAADNQPSP